MNNKRRKEILHYLVLSGNNENETEKPKNVFLHKWPSPDEAKVGMDTQKKEKINFSLRSLLKYAILFCIIFYVMVCIVSYQIENKRFYAKILDIDFDKSIIVEELKKTNSQLNKKYQSFLLSGLKNKNKNIRLECLNYFYFIQPKSKRIISALIKTIEDPEPEVRIKVMMFLSDFPEKAVDAIPLLIERLQDKDLDPNTITINLKEKNEVRIFAAYALGYIGKPAKVAIPELEKGLKDKNDYFSNSCAVALSGIEPSKIRKDVLSLLMKKIEFYEESEHFRHIIWGLGNYGPGAKEAVPLLMRILRDSVWLRLPISVYMRTEIAVNLGRIGKSESRVDYLLKNLLKDIKREVYPYDKEVAEEMIIKVENARQKLGATRR